MENIKLQIEVDVFCANDEQPSPYLIARYVRNHLPTVIMAGDLHEMQDKKDRRRRFRNARTLTGMIRATSPKQDGWDDYSVHLRSKVSILNA